MKLIKLTLLLFISSISFTQIFAQKNNALVLRTETKNLSSNLLDVINNPNSLSGSYQLLTFQSIPDEATKQDLRNHGIVFLEYVPNKTYLVKFSPSNNLDFLKNKHIDGIHALPRELKLDYRIINWDIPQHALSNNDNVKVALIAMHQVDISDYHAQLLQKNIVPYQYGKDKRFAYCELSKVQIEALIQEDWIRSIELIDEPGRPESTEGRTLQKSNLINNHLSNGLSYDASGLKILVRDDGTVGPHIDFTGRLIDLASPGSGTHGDGVAGVMGGAGNIDPSVEGGASGADIYVIDYLASFQDNTLSLHQDSLVMITNSSYSNGCNDGYTSTTQTVDNHVFTNPTLMHVFSAGNSNNTDCGYGAGDQWGNITGGHKMGKNVITVANLYNDASIVSSSSRGPAHDGRIKPDLAAHGQGQMSTDPNNSYDPFGGTSAAAPSLAGNLAQLYEAYKTLNNNNNPKSALIKAAAMNSATDLGNPGPDFIYGYGLINTAKAYEVIANNQYLFSTINQAGTNNHTITVPAGTGQLRIMLYWHDPEATINTNLALINDLDMVVNNTLLPLVLDHTPNPLTLNNAAVPGVDHLNNMEQIVVNNPSPGNYSVQINGYQIPVGPQEYVLVYSFIKDEIKVTYPLGGESLIPGTVERIHWDANGTNGNFNVEYSTNNGASWNVIGTPAGTERNIAWTVPSMNTGDALIRVSRATQSDISDEPFNIYPVPVFSTQTNSATSAIINWASISGATKYYIWRLGAKYMEIIDSSNTTSYILGGLVAGQELWLSVSANTQTITGQRANAQYFTFNPFASCTGCIGSVTSFPYLESFETGLGLFCQSQLDSMDYTFLVGPTPTGSTGPSAASDGTQYIYIEASTPNFPSKLAILGSPCLDLSNLQNAELKFDYHMIGSGMGSLAIEVSVDGGATWSASPIWSKSGSQSNAWRSDSIDFSIYQGNQVSFRFVGLTGTSAFSDIGIDNIQFDGTVVFPSSLNNLESGIQYSLQPNPSEGIFYINTIENLENIKVINSFGQTIQNIDLNTIQNKVLNLQAYAPGIYFVLFKDKYNNISRHKITVL